MKRNGWDGFMLERREGWIEQVYWLEKRRKYRTGLGSERRE